MSHPVQAPLTRNHFFNVSPVVIQVSAAALMFIVFTAASGVQAQNLPLETTLAPIQINAEAEERKAQFKRPVRAQKVTSERIEKRQATDVTRVLRETSGTYSRDEDGQGLRPNIGLRGTNPDRSRKIVFLEDGILIGPAPYAAPAAYYVPSTNLIQDMSVAKGFQAVGFGPNSVGGAVLFRTAQASSETNSTEVRSSIGSFQTLNSRLTTSGTLDQFSYVFQFGHWTSDGFKEVDGGGRAGFNKNDLLLKLKHSNTWFGAMGSTELRVGFSDEVSDETYLGLEQGDFNARFRRRYVASQNDRMSWQNRKVQVQHVQQVGDLSVIEVNAYSHWFDRTWYRFDGFRDTSADKSARAVLQPGGNSTYRDVLRGAINSTDVGVGAQLNLVNNERSYLSQGIQAQFNTESTLTESGDVKSEWQVFARLHRDEINRNHTADYWNVIDGRTVRTTDPRRTDLVNKDSARALTVSAIHDLTLGQENSWVLTQVVRFEQVDFDFQNRTNPSRSLSRADQSVVGGVSILKEITKDLIARTSVNTATTMAGLSGSGQEVKEEAVNFELELRYRMPEFGFDLEATAFQTDYKNITGTCTVSSGCTSQNLDQFFNGGRAKIEGLELGAMGEGRLFSERLPMRLTVTAIRARFENEFESSSPDWGIGTVRAGDPIPYVPSIVYSASIGTSNDRFQQDLIFSYSSEVADQSVAVNRVMIPAYGVVDWTGSYKFAEGFTLLGRIDNVLAREYAVAARPFGLRPGRPQAFSLALQAAF